MKVKTGSEDEQVEDKGKGNKGNIGTCLKRQVFNSMRTSSNYILRRNMDTHQPSKEQASSRTNKDGKEYVKHHIPGQKNKDLGKRKDEGHRRD